MTSGCGLGKHDIGVVGLPDEPTPRGSGLRRGTGPRSCPEGKMRGSAFNVTGGGAVTVVGVSDGANVGRGTEGVTGVWAAMAAGCVAAFFSAFSLSI